MTILYIILGHLFIASICSYFMVPMIDEILTEDEECAAALERTPEMYAKFVCMSCYFLAGFFWPVYLLAIPYYFLFVNKNSDAG